MQKKRVLGEEAKVGEGLRRKAENEIHGCDRILNREREKLEKRGRHFQIMNSFSDCWY